MVELFETPAWHSPDRGLSMAVAYRPYRFSRAEYYAIAGSLDSSLRYELLDGTIYAVSAAKPRTPGS